MKSRSSRLSDYVHRIRKETQRHLEDLFAQNERLRALVASLELEKEAARRALSATQKELEGERADGDALRRHLESIHLERERYFDDFLQVESRNANLASLYAATYQLHASPQLSDVLCAIEDVVVNLIGSEELAIFALEDDGVRLLLASGGVDPDLGTAVPLDGPIAAAIHKSEIFVAPVGEQDPDTPKTLTACIPLTVGDRVIGALAIFELLPQKPGIEPLDLELFDLLGQQAGIALWAARLHERFGAEDGSAKVTRLQ